MRIAFYAGTSESFGVMPVTGTMNVSLLGHPSRFNPAPGNDHLADQAMDTGIVDGGDMALVTHDLYSQVQSGEGDGESCHVCRDPVNLSDRIVEVPCKHKIHKQCYEEILALNKRRPDVTCPTCEEPVLIQSTFWDGKGYRIKIKKSELTGMLPYVGDPVTFTLQDGSEVIVALGFKLTPCLHAGPASENHYARYAYVTENSVISVKMHKEIQCQNLIDFDGSWVERKEARKQEISIDNEEEINKARNAMTEKWISPRRITEFYYGSIAPENACVYRGSSNLSNESATLIFTSAAYVGFDGSRITCLNHPFTPLQWRPPVTVNSVCQKRKITNDSPELAPTSKKAKISSETFACAFEDQKPNNDTIEPMQVEQIPHQSAHPIAKTTQRHNRVKLKMTITSEDGTRIIAELSNITFKGKSVSSLFLDAYVMDGLNNKSLDYSRFVKNFLSVYTTMKPDESFYVLIQQEIDPG